MSEWRFSPVVHDMVRHKVMLHIWYRVGLAQFFEPAGRNCTRPVKTVRRILAPLHVLVRPCKICLDKRSRLKGIVGHDELQMVLEVLSDSRQMEITR